MPIRQKRNTIVKASKVTSIQLVLTLNEHQAEWLKGLMQNPISLLQNPHCNREDELKDVSDLREAIFETIKDNQ